MIMYINGVNHVNEGVDGRIVDGSVLKQMKTENEYLILVEYSSAPVLIF